MGMDEKFDAHLDKAKGQAKETMGELRGDEKQQAEGRADQSKGDLKNAAEKVKDAVGDIFDGDKK